VNSNRRFQKIPNLWCLRCADYARAIVKHYAAGGSPNSLAVSGERGTESNVKRQAQGKFGECALALFLGLDPEHAVNWQMTPDKGTDIVLADGIRVDVKTTFPPFKLIWSNSINGLYEKKLFDVLVSVSIIQDHFAQCWIEGWITKGAFLKHKKIASGSNGGLETGTWFVEKSSLSNIDDLPFLPRKVVNNG
jgi:hypothetical protein